LLSELTRQENETIKSYKLRLFRNKELYDIDTKQIADLIDKETGETFNESTYRKWFRNYEEGFVDARKESLSDEDILKELDIKQTSLQKEKYKIQTLRLDLNRIIRESSRSELLVEEFINAIKESSPLPYPEFKPLQNQINDKQYVLSFADSHFGKQFESITNTYDLDIVYDRFNKLMSETIDIIEECKINKLIVLALGDLIEGMCLRISQLSNIKIGITKQTIQFMRFIVSWLNKLSEYVEIDYYQTPYSNHTQIRPFGTKANDFADEDMEQIIFVYIHDMLDSNPRVKVNECLSKYLIFKIFNYNIIAGHGHDIKNTTDFIKDASSKYKIFFDYAFFAHKHSNGNKAVGEGDSNNCEIINVPSIMGSDEYADSLFVGSKAGATLIEFTEKQGKRKTYDIILN